MAPDVGGTSMRINEVIVAIALILASILPVQGTEKMEGFEKWLRTDIIKQGQDVKFTVKMVLFKIEGIYYIQLVKTWEDDVYGSWAKVKYEERDIDPATRLVEYMEKEKLRALAGVIEKQNISLIPPSAFILHADGIEISVRTRAGWVRVSANAPEYEEVVQALIGLGLWKQREGPNIPKLEGE